MQHYKFLCQQCTVYDQRHWGSLVNTNSCSQLKKKQKWTDCKQMHIAHRQVSNTATYHQFSLPQDTMPLAAHMLSLLLHVLASESSLTRKIVVYCDEWWTFVHLQLKSVISITCHVIPQNNNSFVYFNTAVYGSAASALFSLDFNNFRVTVVPPGMAIQILIHSTKRHLFFQKREKVSQQ